MYPPAGQTQQTVIEIADSIKSNFKILLVNKSTINKKLQEYKMKNADLCKK